jgi:hypothetical protein
MHEESLTKNTQRVLETLNSSAIVKDFYLAGGSALALYYGHRLSVDLDWFNDNFSPNPLFRKKLSDLGDLTVNEESEGTFHGSLDGVKISFLRYPYPLLDNKTKYQENVYLASKKDIAVMKLEAVAGRGTYKDFIDVYFLLEEYTIEELFSFLKEKFKGIDYNETHLIKSLNYFEDVEKSEMPKMIKEINWDDVKKKLNKTVEEYYKY